MKRIAIITLSSDTFSVLIKLLDSIVEFVSCDYKFYLGYNSPNNHDEVLRVVHDRLGDKAKVIFYDHYNFSKLNNDIVRNHLEGEEKILFCNNDIVFRDRVVDNISYVLENNDNIGTVGCRLVYENGLIQHDGQYVLIDKTTGLFRGVSHLKLNESNIDNEKDYRLVSGNTFALCGTTRNNFDLVGGLNEEYLKCFEDVEFNLELYKKGLDNIICPSKYWAYHLESYSRKKEKGPYVEPEDVWMISDYTNKNFNDTNNQIFIK